MLEIPNVMLVCKFKINWSTNKNLRAHTIYLGPMDGKTDAWHFHILCSALQRQWTIKVLKALMEVVAFCVFFLLRVTIFHLFYNNC